MKTQLTSAICIAMITLASESMAGESQYKEFCDALQEKAEDGTLELPVPGIKKIYKDLGYGTKSHLFKVLSGSAEANDEVRGFLMNECGVELH